jgi:hypothetical protein
MVTVTVRVSGQLFRLLEISPIWPFIDFKKSEPKIRKPINKIDSCGFFVTTTLPAKSANGRIGEL